MVSRVVTLSLLRPGSWISDLLARLGQWWLDEFVLLFPERVSAWLTDRGYRRLILSAEQDVFVLQLQSDRRRLLASVRIARSAFSPASIDDFLKARNLDREGVMIGLRLPRGQIFSRQLLLPREAAGSIDEIVAQDLAAKTPFRLADVYDGHQSRPVDGKVMVWQWVVRREFVAGAAEAAGLSLADVAFVESDDGGSDGAPAPVLPLRQDRKKHHSLMRKIVHGLALGTALLAIIGGAHKYWRQQRMLDRLNAELATARGEAQRVRATLDKLDQKQAAIVRLRLQKREGTSLLDVWEEASHILPANSWLTELRLSEVAQGEKQLVIMTGLSAAAAELVALVDKSPLFADAALTAPIALDSVEKRERFTLQARLLPKHQSERLPP